jgi:hypothetical protein
MATIKYEFPYAKSGPMFESYEVDEHWFKEFIKCVDSCTLDGPARDALIAHVMDRVAKPAGACVGIAEFDYMPERPQPIGYVSESGLQAIRQLGKAFIRREPDSLARIPIYAGKRND